MMLRRLKEDVEKNLAPKEETIIEVELTNIQKKYYRAILERNFSFLSKGSTGNSNVPNLMNTVMELRKCCNHPFLINGMLALQFFTYTQTHTHTYTYYCGACVAQRERNGLPCDGPGFDSRSERCIYRASRPSQGTVNGGAVSK